MNQNTQPQQSSYARFIEDERHQDRLDYSAKCNHVYETWVGNPMILRCRCGDWHYKNTTFA